MRTEEEVRNMYKIYVAGYATATNKEMEDQFFGAAIACGRTLGKDIKRIKKDFEVTKEVLRQQFKN